jgi:hypothetical protein
MNKGDLLPLVTAKLRQWSQLLPRRSQCIADQIEVTRLRALSPVRLRTGLNYLLDPVRTGSEIFVQNCLLASVIDRDPKCGFEFGLILNTSITQPTRPCRCAKD